MMIPALPNRAGISTGDRGIKLLESDGFYRRNLMYIDFNLVILRNFLQKMFSLLKKLLISLKTISHAAHD